MLFSDQRKNAENELKTAEYFYWLCLIMELNIILSLAERATMTNDKGGKIKLSCFVFYNNLFTNNEIRS